VNIPNNDENKELSMSIEEFKSARLGQRFGFLVGCRIKNRGDWGDV
jgi:hypothetical protein